MAEEKEKSKGKEDVKEGGTPKDPAKAAARKKMIIIAAVVVVDIVIMGALAMFIASKLRAPAPTVEAHKTEEEEEKKRREKHTKIGMTLPKPLTFTVNISSPTGGEHYLKCSIQLEWEAAEHEGEEKKAEGGGGGHGGGGALDPLGTAITERMPKINDIIINILSSEPYSEMLKPMGKQKMKEAMVSEINAILPEEHGHLTNAFFTEFLVQ